MQTFYVVATPIGNLGDLTFRAKEVLSSVDFILCEDTRVTGKLLKHYGIHTSMISYHSQSSDKKHESIMEMVKEGKILALVSDAGTPSVSDPGSLLVANLREAFPDLNIVSVPGPSALTAAISISGLSVSEFVFLGFLPHKKGRQTIFNEIKESKRAVIFYESPHRIMKTVDSLIELGVKKQVVIAREMTKMFEEIISGSLEEVRALLLDNPKKQKGEFVVVIKP